MLMGFTNQLITRHPQHVCLFCPDLDQETLAGSAMWSSREAEISDDTAENDTVAMASG